MVKAPQTPHTPREAQHVARSKRIDVVDSVTEHFLKARYGRKVPHLVDSVRQMAQHIRCKSKIRQADIPRDAFKSARVQAL